MPAPSQGRTRPVHVTIDSVHARGPVAQGGRGARSALRRSLAPALAGRIAARDLDRIAGELSAAIARRATTPGADGRGD